MWYVICALHENLANGRNQVGSRIIVGETLEAPLFPVWKTFVWKQGVSKWHILKQTVYQSYGFIYYAVYHILNFK